MDKGGEVDEEALSYVVKTNDNEVSDNAVGFSSAADPASTAAVRMDAAPSSPPHTEEEEHQQQQEPHSQPEDETETADPPMCGEKQVPTRAMKEPFVSNNDDVKEANCGLQSTSSAPSLPLDVMQCPVAEPQGETQQQEQEHEPQDSHLNQQRDQDHQGHTATTIDTDGWDDALELDNEQTGERAAMAEHLVTGFTQSVQNLAPTMDDDEEEEQEQEEDEEPIDMEVIREHILSITTPRRERGSAAKAKARRQSSSQAFAPLLPRSEDHHHHHDPRQGRCSNSNNGGQVVTSPPATAGAGAGPTLLPLLPTHPHAASTSDAGSMMSSAGSGNALFPVSIPTTSTNTNNNNNNNNNNTVLDITGEAGNSCNSGGIGGGNPAAVSPVPTLDRDIHWSIHMTSAVQRLSVAVLESLQQEEASSVPGDQAAGSSSHPLPAPSKPQRRTTKKAAPPSPPPVEKRWSTSSKPTTPSSPSSRAILKKKASPVPHLTQQQKTTPTATTPHGAVSSVDDEAEARALLARYQECVLVARAHLRRTLAAKVYVEGLTQLLATMQRTCERLHLTYTDLLSHVQTEKEEKEEGESTMTAVHQEERRAHRLVFQLHAALRSAICAEWTLVEKEIEAASAAPHTKPLPLGGDEPVDQGTAVMLADAAWQRVEDVLQALLVESSSEESPLQQEATTRAERVKGEKRGDRQKGAGNSRRSGGGGALLTTLMRQGMGGNAKPVAATSPPPSLSATMTSISGKGQLTPRTPRRPITPRGLTTTTGPVSASAVALRAFTRVAPPTYHKLHEWCYRRGPMLFQGCGASAEDDSISASMLAGGGAGHWSTLAVFLHSQVWSPLLEERTHTAVEAASSAMHSPRAVVVENSSNTAGGEGSPAGSSSPRLSLSWAAAAASPQGHQPPLGPLGTAAALESTSSRSASQLLGASTEWGDGTAAGDGLSPAGRAVDHLQLWSRELLGSLGHLIRECDSEAEAAAAAHLLQTRPRHTTFTDLLAAQAEQPNGQPSGKTASSRGQKPASHHNSKKPSPAKPGSGAVAGTGADVDAVLPPYNEDEFTDWLQTRLMETTGFIWFVRESLPLSLLLRLI